MTSHRLAHRIRDMQTLPYVVVSNEHISEVYELYYQAFESLRRIREVKTLDDNERLCQKISQTLQQHLPVIPKLSMGILECRDLMKPEDMDKFMNTILRSVMSVSGMFESVANTSPANLSTSNSRAASCLDRDVQFAMAFSRSQKSF